MEEGASPLERNLGAKILAFALSSLHGTASLIHCQRARRSRHADSRRVSRTDRASSRVFACVKVHAPRRSSLSRPTCPGPGGG